MNEYRCESCGFVYDPEEEMNSGIYFKDTPATYVCPACKAGKHNFQKLGKEYASARDEFDKLKKDYLSGKG